MIKTNKIAVIVGSLRKDSFNRKIANNLIRLAPASLKMEIIEIGHLPLYNQDKDPTPPDEWVTFRDTIKPFDGILFATPEYNRSIPGVLKNAIDIGSRPYGKSVWDGKPTAVISASPSAIGAFGSNQHLRQTFVFLNMPCMQMPEAYLGQVDKLLDDQGNLKNDDTKQFLSKFMEAYAKWVEKNKRPA